MKILQFVQANLKLLGLTSKPSIENRAMMILGFVCLAIFIVLELIFLCKANGIIERMESLYVLSSAAVIDIAYATLTIRMSAMVELIEDFEAVINESELNFL